MFLLSTISIVVMKMKEIKRRKKGSLITSLLRLFGKARGYEELTSGREEIVHTGISGANHYYRRKEITDWLEAERKKAEVLMEREKRSFIC